VIIRKSLSIIAAGMFFLPLWAGAETSGLSAPLPWMNTALDADARADLLLAQMTQDEQLQMVMGYVGADQRLPYGRPPPEALRPFLPGTAGYIPGIPRLGIPALVESDAGLGIANNSRMRPLDQATAFPSGVLTAATWNPALATQMGAAIGTEARVRGFNVLLGGAMNLAREPRSGRTFEYAGEDPLLAGIIAGAEVRGVQNQHIISTVKHFALNDQETGRTVLNAVIDEAAARESDLLAFEIAIERSDPGAVMCAYNRVNGTYACENPFLLTNVLKTDWKYPGWVLSDWGAVHSTADSANAGLDQESAAGFDGKEYFGAPLKQALVDGTIAPARLHDMVHRVLRSMIAKGLFDYPAEKVALDVEANRPIAQKDAEEGIVLLKNDAKLLPLSRKVPRIAIIGAHADIGVLSGGGSSQVVPVGHSTSDEFPVGGAIQMMRNGAKVPPKGTEIFDPPSPLLAIRAFAPNTTVAYDGGENVQIAAELARQCDVAIVFASQWMAEGRDVPSLGLPGDQDSLIEAVAAANPRTIVVLETGGPVLMPWLPHASAVLEAWYAGSGGAAAIARVLFGGVNPSGKLPLTFPQTDDQLPRPVIPGAAPGMPFDVNYVEGADVGYRWFERKNLTPLFPFGYGLSYTNFRIDGLTANAMNSTVSASVDVANVGTVPGSETVQLYAAPPGDNGPDVRRLVGWSKVELKPGEKHHVTIVAEPRLLASFDTARHVWRMLDGTYELSAGNSSAALSQSVNVHLPAREFAP
jgi:beta-glucosidase